jgi:hypothetical protein
MTPNEQTVVDEEESPISLSQCFATVASPEFIFDVTLSTAVAAIRRSGLHRKLNRRDQLTGCETDQSEDPETQADAARGKTCWQGARDVR